MTADLPDLLRLACRQGSLRLHVWHSAERGHQANLANSGQGWTVDHDRDPLEAIAKVLRTRYGSMLERERVAVELQQIDIEEAIADAVDADLTDLIG